MMSIIGLTILHISVIFVGLALGLISFIVKKTPIPVDFWIFAFYFFCVYGFIFFATEINILLLPVIPSIFGLIIFLLNRKQVLLERKKVDFVGILIFITGLVLLAFLRYQVYYKFVDNLSFSRLFSFGNVVFDLFIIYPASFGEEIIFRWFGVKIYRKAGFNRILSSLIVGVIFITMHVSRSSSIIDLCSDTIFTILLFLFAVKYRNLFFSVFFHIIYNSFEVIILSLKLIFS